MTVQDTYFKSNLDGQCCLRVEKGKVGMQKCLTVSRKMWNRNFGSNRIQ